MASRPALIDLPPALALEVDALCDDFERRWRKARRQQVTPPGVDEFVSRASVSAQAVLREYLVDLERELREGVMLPTLPGLILEEEIGRGGMGVVYRARREVDGRIVALKLIPGVEYARWSGWRAELADLHHPNLVPLEAFGTHEGLHYVVMPLAAGGDLNERFDEFAPASPTNRDAVRATVALMAGVADAVAFLHQFGILHRDLKPSNILLDARHDPRPLVCDFGLANRLDEVAATGHIAGTPRYMAPEGRAGQPLTAAADVWSLGAVLAELFAATIEPDTPIDRLCRRCLAAQPTERCTAAELAADLRLTLESI